MESKRRPAEQIHILLADDNDEIRHALGEELSAKGYDVIHASDGEVAIEILQSRKVDIAVLDIKMPQVDGFAVLEFIKKNFPEMKTIMLTAYADLENAKKCKQLGADDLIAKPYDLGDLFLTLEYFAGLSK